jgi:orotidine-5'-phosphate decarboxylase
MQEPRQSLCYALDVSSAAEAQDQVKQLAPHVGIFKVGLQLFIREGPALIRSIHEHGAKRIFLDLKLLDIPRTVHQARVSAGEMPVEFLTVHCEGLTGQAVTGDGKEGSDSPRLLAVTLLTSLEESDLRRLGYRRNLSLLDIVYLRTDIAKDAGCAGVVCSGREVEAVRNRAGKDFMVVTPGIRPSWTEVTGDDQRRTRTAREAIRAGADILVVGRPIRKASNPADAAQRLLEDIEKGQKDRFGTA